MSSLSSNLTKIKNATDVIRTAVSMPDDDISDVAAVVSSLGGKNSYKASSISEMRAISSASEGDICVVHSDPEFVDVTEGMPFNVLYLPKVVENVNLDSYVELSIAPVNNNLSSSGGITINPEEHKVDFDVVFSNFPEQGNSFNLIVAYSYVGTTLSLNSVSYSINSSIIAVDLDNCILNLPISFSINSASDYEVPSDLGKFIKTYKIIDWDPLTYSNNLVFVPEVPLDTFVFPTTVNKVKFMPSPYLTPFLNSDSVTPQTINFTSGPADLSFSGYFNVQEFCYDAHSFWGFDIRYQENCEGSYFTRLTNQGVIYPTINSFVQVKNNSPVDTNKNILFRSSYELGLFGLDDSVTYNDLLPFARILKTYADGSYTTYVYHDNEWNIVYRSI